MLYEVTLRQRLFEQQVINTFAYNSAGTPAVVSGSFALMSALGFIPDGVTGLLPAGGLGVILQGIQSSAVTWEEVEVAALYDPVDFYTLPYSPVLSGGVTGEATSPVLAYGLTSSRVRRDIRRGQKRVAGVVENHVNAGGVIASAMFGNLVDLGEEMSDVQTYNDEGNSLTFSPVILSFEKRPTSGGRFAYYPYPTLAEQLEHTAQGISWSPKTQVRTQNSRQYGRGS